ncbi:hypothetical protein M0R72_16715 [Candidatus Pacearchaeota archaeon]|jgi:hypothetical protein|nr:hypothetical protein [Candidatus Pacearchaeota archaeon]
MNYKLELTDEGKAIRRMLTALKVWHSNNRESTDEADPRTEAVHVSNVLAEAECGTVLNTDREGAIHIISWKSKTPDRLIYLMLAWGWIDLYCDPTTVEIADAFMVSGYHGPHGVYDDVRTERVAWLMAQELEAYIGNVAKRSGVRWHFESARTSGTGRTLVAVLTAAGGRHRQVWYNGSWHISG